MSRLRGGSAGQASVELVAVLPVAVLVGLCCAQLLAAGLGRTLAGHAAEAAAIALVRDADPEAAARDALPDWAARRVHVTVDGREAHVSLASLRVVPGLADVLAPEATADAGPTP